MAVNCCYELSANFREYFEVLLQEKRDMNVNDVKFPCYRFVLASALPYVCLILKITVLFVSFFSSLKCSQLQ